MVGPTAPVAAVPLAAAAVPWVGLGLALRPQLLVLVVVAVGWLGRGMSGGFSMPAATASTRWACVWSDDNRETS